VSAPHIDDDLLDRYALGLLGLELIAPLEEHLLACPRCQTRLIAVDEFAWLFRTAATQSDARPQRRSWRRLNARLLVWATGAAAVVVAVFLSISAQFGKAPAPPATVFLYALRGPDAAAVITARKPVRLVFDLTPAGPARDYEVQIVDLLGNQVLAIPVEFSDGHLAILIGKLKSGSYWVRIRRKGNDELIAEYGLRAE
jgi:hypothetical protein